MLQQLGHLVFSTLGFEGHSRWMFWQCIVLGGLWPRMQVILSIVVTAIGVGAFVSVESSRCKDVREQSILSLFWA